jgi:hypothetical protein
LDKWVAFSSMTGERTQVVICYENGTSVLLAISTPVEKKLYNPLEGYSF